jgi:hypothetical protein
LVCIDNGCYRQWIVNGVAYNKQKQNYKKHTFCTFVSVEQFPNTIPAMLAPYLRNGVTVESFVCTWSINNLNDIWRPCCLTYWNEWLKAS